MPMGFTKLHGTIIHSSMWQEDSDTRVVWITMLALADATGTVYASIGGLSHAARVSRESCEKAIAKFLGPDPDSRDRTTGERIREVDGGWFIINHANYRDRQTREQALAAERQRKWRQAHGVTCNDRNVTGRDVTLSASNPSASVSASASPSPLSPSGEGEGEVQERERERDDAFDRFWTAFDHKKGRKKAHQAWAKVKRSDWEEIIRVAGAYRASITDQQFQKHPATWLNGECWNDAITVSKNSNGFKQHISKCIDEESEGEKETRRRHQLWINGLPDDWTPPTSGDSDA